MDEIVRSYSAATPGSRKTFDRIRRVLPGGETRSVTFYRPYPVVIARGAGAHVWDVDGREYVDVLNNYTSLIHGHASARLVAAATEAMGEGTAYPAPGLHQLALAEELTSRYPAVELVRFTNSGTEASLLALRLARHATGRRRILMFEGGYHGTAPEFVDSGPDTVRVPYNDIQAVRSALDESVAAVFAEPFLGSGGVVPAAPGFLDAVAEIATATGALFVLDEVQSLRTYEHGVQAELRSKPDLVLMGKIIGGGFPVGALGGKFGLMQLTAADRPGALTHSGTFNGNPVTTAAGLASMRLLDAGAIDTLNARAQQVVDGIEAAAREVGIPVVVSRYGSIMHVHFRNQQPTNAADVREEPADAITALHLALLLRGVYAAPRGMLNLSTPISSPDLDQLLTAYSWAFTEIARAGLVPVPATA